MKTIFVDAYNTFILPNGGGINEEMYRLLEIYPNRKIVLTNADDGEMASFGIDQSPYEVFTLKHQPNKTDPEYYRTMLAHFALDAGDVTYFEHNADAVASARSVGINTYLYNKDERDLKALKGFIDMNS
jgi:FMN phosphatase YigB (HAD superfamily)